MTLICPNCNYVIRENGLVVKYSRKGCKWYQLSGYERHCPLCGAHVEYDVLSQLYLVISAIPVVSLSVWALVSPSTLPGSLAGIVATVSFLIGVILMRKTQKLVLIDNDSNN